MSLSNKSINRISAALAEEVVEELIESQEWIEFLHTNIGGIIVDKLGQLDDEVLCGLIMCVADRIGMKAYTNLD